MKVKFKDNTHVVEFEKPCIVKCDGYCPSGYQIAILTGFSPEEIWQTYSGEDITAYVTGFCPIDE